ncbi:MAG TPA: translation factor GTPase family protein [Streptosporangiaceae bacterium]|nr:translation factor GTPase family protein [Streptosporangiaceae bacterium]
MGILAHVDAGKTSLTERLLHAAGVIDEIGSVDDGSTQTDFLALERQRGITIKSAVVSFPIGDVTVNLIDTPGHPDFIAEVERVLSVLDGTVLVISAVEGVQAQTRVLMRALQRLHIPVVIFVNKIDRGGAEYGRVLREISRRLTPAIIAMGSAHGLGTHSAGFTPYGAGDAAFVARLADVLTGRNDTLLAAYVDDEAAVTYRRLRRELAVQARRALVHPVYFGSALTGAGVGPLTAGIREFLPAAAGPADGPVSGTVFKVERGPAGEKVAYARMFSGTLRVRDRLRPGRRGERDAGGEGKITAISVFERGPATQRASITAGQIGKLWGLGDIQIGDTLGTPRAAPARHAFAPPTLETVVVPRRPADKGALHLALTQLAEQDPLINLRQDDIRQEMYVSLYGEVQKEVVEATLADDFGIDVTFRETTTICIERPAGTGAAVETLHQPANPFIATVGLRVEPAQAGAGVRFRLAIEPGSLPVPFRKAVEDSARATLRQGLSGWEVTDCTITLTRSGYVPPQGKRGQAFDASISSTAGDFRHLTPLVLMSALKQAGTTVYEPVHRFHLEIPADTAGLIYPALALLGAVPRAPATRDSLCLLDGDIPAARVHELQQQLPALTRGEGVLEWAFDHYRPVRGPVPARPRTDHNPLDRDEYLLHVVRRVAGR